MARPDPHQPIPNTPLWLGAGGLLPFIILAGSLWLAPEPYRPMLADWLRSYAAVILTFVGAVHWGFAMLHPKVGEGERDTIMAWSVVPALVGWVGMIVPLRHGLVFIAAMFVIQLSMDRAFARRFTLPPWYLSLRNGLTAVVVVCIGLAALHG